MVKSSEYRGVTLFRPTGKWRAQISAGGKTTSLGDHDSEAEAARAFDRACINKNGTNARTNFPLDDYAAELTDLMRMPQTELVAMLRSRARKSGTQTSHYRGVSLLKQTGKWHAQINVGGKQVHLGFFATEQLAARAYDRAAINKGARDGGKIITNFDIRDYETELDYLRRIPQDQLVFKLSKEDTRKGAMDLLANGFTDACSSLFPIVLDENRADALPAVDTLITKAERAAPKPTAKDPLYPNFGKSMKKEVPKTPEKMEHRADGQHGRVYQAAELRRGSVGELSGRQGSSSEPPYPLPQFGSPANTSRGALGPMSPMPLAQSLFANAFTEFTPKSHAVAMRDASDAGAPSSPGHSLEHSEAQPERRTDGRSSVQGVRRSAKRRLVELMGTPSPHSSNDGPYSYPGGAEEQGYDVAILPTAASGALEAASGALATPPRPSRAAYLGLATPAKQELALPRLLMHDDVDMPNRGPHVGPRSTRRPRAVVHFPAFSKEGSEHGVHSEDETDNRRRTASHVAEQLALSERRKNTSAALLSGKRYSPWRRNQELLQVEDEAESQGAKDASDQDKMPSRRRKAAPARAAVA